MNVPAVEYAWVGDTPTAVVPSPEIPFIGQGEPPASLERLPSNWIGPFSTPKYGPPASATEVWQTEVFVIVIATVAVPDRAHTVSPGQRALHATKVAV